MKTNDKVKKDKLTLTKTPLHTQTKKLQIKKNSTKKQQEVVKKSYSSATLSKATNSGLSSGTQTSKYSQMTAKISPKTSLADIRELKQCQSHKALLSSKLKYEKQKIQYKPMQLVNNFTKVVQSKPIIVDKAKQEIKRSLANVIKSYYPVKKTCLDISMTQVTKDATQKDERIVNTHDFNFMEVVGEGGYGKVWKVEQLKTRKHFAMKEMSKAAIIMKKSVDNVLNERKILQKLHHQFIANMHYAFNDRDNLYLVMDLLAGGDLRYHIGRIQRFTEQQTKFLVGCIVVAIEYIHKMKIFHRDIKPQNLVFDEFGYLKLTDFGIARIDSPSQTLDASGTPGYMAPEVLCKQVHAYAVDFYALGIICYELILGKRPYHGNNRNEIRDAILSKQHAMKKTELPSGHKVEAIDFVNKLITRQPNSRLGTKQGTKQLKSHPWFKGFNWDALSARKMKSPFKGKYIMEVDQNMNEDELLMQYKLLQRADDKLDPFAKYYFQMGEREM